MSGFDDLKEANAQLAQAYNGLKQAAEALESFSTSQGLPELSVAIKALRQIASCNPWSSTAATHIGVARAALRDLGVD